MVQNDSPELPKGRQPATGNLRQYRLYFLESVDSLIS